MLWRRLTRGVRVLVDRTAADRDIADEIEQYAEEAASSLEANGMSPEDARRAARQQIGSLSVVREQVRGYGWEHAIETTVSDVNYGLRQLRRRPGFAALGSLTLALGIGASTAMFSAVNPVLFQPLPYPDPDRVIAIWDGQTGTRSYVTFGTYRELTDRSRTFESMAVMRPMQATLVDAKAEPERLDGQYVSAEYFRTLGVRPALGRDFQAADDQPRAPVVVLISDALWRRRFGANPAIVDRQVVFDGRAVTVIGVLPAGFENVLSPSAELWTALQYDTALPLNGREWGHHLRMVARVRPGVDPDLAGRELNTIAREPLASFPRPQWASLQGGGLIAERLQDDLTRGVKPALLAVLGAVALLLAIACVNVTNLLLARGAERRMEFAVRTALGASRWRVIRQRLVETLPLAACGGTLGIALAHAGVDALVSMSPPELPRAETVAVDNAALLFALGLTTLIGLTTGVVQALHGSFGELSGGAQQRSSRIAGGSQLTRRALVVVQVALALVLLAGAGLLVRSLQHLFAVPPGFDPAGLLTMRVETSGQRFRDAGATHRFYERALEAVQQVPGVSAAAFTSQLPLTGDEDVWGVHFESVPTVAAEENRDGYRYAVSPGYFEAMGIPLRGGRFLDPHDIANAPLAAVINESFANRRLPGVNPIGQRLHIGPNSGPWFTVVGVVGDVKQTALDVGRSDIAYVTAAQWSRFADSGRWLVVRANGDAAAVTPAIRGAIWSIDKDQPILRVATMDERLRASAAQRRFALLLFEAFGVVALILAAIGTYSLLSGNVTERTREIGVRAALGATRQQILALVLRQGMTLAGLGILLGLVGAMVGSRALVTLLFGISRLDSTTYLGVVTLLGSVSAIACAMPAWRAARVRPSIALRSD